MGPSRSPRSALPVVVLLLAAWVLLGGASFRVFLIDPDLAALSFLLLAAVALLGLLRGAPAAAGDAVGRLTLLLAGWALLSAALAVVPRLATEHALWQLLWAGLFCAGWAVRDAATRLACVTAVLLVATLVGALAVAEAAGLRQPATLYLTEFGRARAMATLNHPNNLAGFCALVLPPVVAWALAAGRARPDRAVGWSVSALVLLAAAGGTYSKGGQLAVVVGLATLVWWLPAEGWRAWWRRDPRRAGGLLVLGALLALAAAVLFWRSEAAARIRLFIDLIPTLPRFQRWGTWIAAWRMAVADPLTGAGPGCFGVQMAWARLGSAYAELYTHAHNWYLNTLAEQGWPGLLLLLGWWGVVLRAVARRVRTAIDRPARLRAVGLLAGLTGFAWAGCLDYNVGVPPIAATFWFLAGLATASDAPASVGRSRRGGLAAAAALVALSVCWLVWNRGQLWYLRACGEVSRGDLVRATELLERAQQLDPRQRAYRLVACDLALWSGDAPRAVRLLSELDRGQPGLESYYRARLAWLHVGEGRREAAQQILDRAIRDDRAEPMLQVDRGFLALSDGDLPAAERWFKAALAHSANSVGACAGLGEIALRRGDRAAAAAWFRQGADRLDPRDRPARFLVAYNRIDPLLLLPSEPRSQRLDRDRFHGEAARRLRDLEAAARRRP